MNRDLDIGYAIHLLQMGFDNVAFGLEPQVQTATAGHMLHVVKAIRAVQDGILFLSFVYHHSLLDSVDINVYWVSQANHAVCMALSALRDAAAWDGARIGGQGVCRNGTVIEEVNRQMAAVATATGHLLKAYDVLYAYKPTASSCQVMK